MKIAGIKLLFRHKLSINKISAEIKAKVNEIIRNLCVTELENIAGLEYYEKATFLGDALSFKRGGIKEC